MMMPSVGSLPRMLTLGLIALFLGAAVVQAHDPRFHSVRLVRFEKPPPAPDFSLEDIKGEKIALSDFRGRFVLLNFWATWCPPCVREMPSMEALSRRMAGRPLTVLAVSLDTQGAVKVRPFLKRLGITFPVALDPDSVSSRAYGASDLPSTFLIDPKGRVVLAAKGERDWGSDAMVAYLLEVMEIRP